MSSSPSCVHDDDAHTSAQACNQIWRFSCPPGKKSEGLDNSMSTDYFSMCDDGRTVTKNTSCDATITTDRSFGHNQGTLSWRLNFRNFANLHCSYVYPLRVAFGVTEPPPKPPSSLMPLHNPGYCEWMPHNPERLQASPDKEHSFTMCLDTDSGLFNIVDEETNERVHQENIKWYRKYLPYVRFHYYTIGSVELTPLPQHG